MNAQQIADQIETTVRRYKPPDYGVWTIGITDDPGVRRQQHGSDGKDTKDWNEWRADSESVARAVEKHFLDRGMKGGGGGPTRGGFVYIF